MFAPGYPQRKYSAYNEGMFSGMKEDIALTFYYNRRRRWNNGV